MCCREQTATVRPGARCGAKHAAAALFVSKADIQKTAVISRRCTPKIAADLNAAQKSPLT